MFVQESCLSQAPTTRSQAKEEKNVFRVVASCTYLEWPSCDDDDDVKSAARKGKKDNANSLLAISILTAISLRMAWMVGEC